MVTHRKLFVNEQLSIAILNKQGVICLVYIVIVWVKLFSFHNACRYTHSPKSVFK